MRLRERLHTFEIEEKVDKSEAYVNIGIGASVTFPKSSSSWFSLMREAKLLQNRMNMLTNLSSLSNWFITALTRREVRQTSKKRGASRLKWGIHSMMLPSHRNT